MALLALERAWWSVGQHRRLARRTLLRRRSLVRPRAEAASPGPRASGRSTGRRRPHSDGRRAPFAASQPRSGRTTPGGDSRRRSRPATAAPEAYQAVAGRPRPPGRAEAASVADQTSAPATARLIMWSRLPHRRQLWLAVGWLRSRVSRLDLRRRRRCRRRRRGRPESVRTRRRSPPRSACWFGRPTGCRGWNRRHRRRTGSPAR